MSGWRLSSAGIVAGIAVSFSLSACGGQASLDAGEPSGNFRVQVTDATFPASQALSGHSRMVISVRNAGTKTIPNVAVTITDPRRGTAVQAFAAFDPTPGLASHSRPVWIIDRAPGPCRFSCLNGGPGGATTAYANTWALGSLKPGATATFKWLLTAVMPGAHAVQYEVAAGLNGKAKAILAGGGKAKGVFLVRISNSPEQSYVDNSGNIVKQ